MVNLVQTKSKCVIQTESGKSFTVPLNPRIALKCDLSDCESTVIVAVTSEIGALLESLPTKHCT